MGLRLVADVGQAEGGGEALGGVDGDDEGPHPGPGGRNTYGGRHGGLPDTTASGHEQGAGHDTGPKASLRLAATSPGV